jgi:hypothetical protein
MLSVSVALYARQFRLELTVDPAERRVSLRFAHQQRCNRWELLVQIDQSAYSTTRFPD